MRTRSSLLGPFVALGLTLAGLQPSAANAGSVTPTFDSRVQSITLQTDLVTRGALGAETIADTDDLTSYVVLPQGYGDDPSKKWPLLVLLHGASGSPGGDNSWLQNGDVERLTANLPAIVLLPEGGEMSNYTNWVGGSAHPPQWETFHMQQLMSAVLDRYHVLPGRQWHAIAGLSGGGQGALRYAAKYPQFFGSVAAFSAGAPDMTSPEVYLLYPVIFGQKSGTVVTYEDTFGPLYGANSLGNSPIRIEDNLRHSRIYVSSGNGLPCVPADVTSTYAVDSGTEIILRRQADEFSASLRKHGIAVDEEHTCGVHNWTVWTRDLKDTVNRWGFFRPVPAAPQTWTYDTGMKAGAAWNVGYDFATAPTKVVRFTRSYGRLSISGGGPVDLTYGGCSTTLTAPTTITLASICG